MAKKPFFDKIDFSKPSRRIRKRDRDESEGLSNLTRAQAAHEGIKAFALRGHGSTKYEDAETILADFLGDTIHWCRMSGVDFEEALRRGRGYVAYEAAGTD